MSPFAMRRVFQMRRGNLTVECIGKTMRDRVCFGSARSVWSGRNVWCGNNRKFNKFHVPKKTKRTDNSHAIEIERAAIVEISRQTHANATERVSE